MLTGLVLSELCKSIQNAPILFTTCKFNSKTRCFSKANTNPVCGCVGPLSVYRSSRGCRSIRQSLPYVAVPPPPQPGAQSTHAEPAIDFEVDVKVDISSGQCVLHPKEPKLDDHDLKGSVRSLTRSGHHFAHMCIFFYNLL